MVLCPVLMYLLHCFMNSSTKINGEELQPAWVFLKIFANWVQPLLGLELLIIIYFGYCCWTHAYWQHLKMKNFQFHMMWWINDDFYQTDIIQCWRIDNFTHTVYDRDFVKRRGWMALHDFTGSKVSEQSKIRIFICFFTYNVICLLLCVLIVPCYFTY